mgnify:CR=1 FL=1
MSGRRRGRFQDTVNSWSPLKKSLFLIVIAILVYGTVIALDETVITKFTGEEYMHTDIKVYRDRTSTILEGGLLYTDVHTETPPLISYFLIPAQLLGGGDHIWVYSAYFSFFGILSGLLIYHVLRRYDDRSAFAMGLLFILSPFGFVEAGLGQDETIMVFTVIVAALLMAIERNRLASLAIGLGIWTKMWAILLAPVHFLYLRSWRERGIMIGILAAVTILVTVPFLVLAGDEFIWFLQYYFIGNPDRTAEGFSVYQFLKWGGFGLPNMISLTLVLIGLLVAYLYSYKKNLGKWESMTLAIVVFFVLYPKMHTGYYLIPIAFLLAWGAENWKIAARCLLIPIPVWLATAFSPMIGATGDNAAFFQFEGSWILGMLFALAASVMLLETTHAAMKNRSFITRAIEGERSRGSAGGPMGSSIAGPLGLD